LPCFEWSFDQRGKNAGWRQGVFEIRHTPFTRTTTGTSKSPSEAVFMVRFERRSQDGFPPSSMPLNKAKALRRKRIIVLYSPIID